MIFFPYQFGTNATPTIPFFFFQGKVLLSSLDWPQTQAMLLPQFSNCWVYRHGPSYSTLKKLILFLMYQTW